MLVAQLLPAPARPAPAAPRKAPVNATAPPAPPAHHPADSHEHSTAATHHAAAAHDPTVAHHAAAAHQTAAHVPVAGDPDPEQTAALELALIRREQTFDVATKQRAEDERETNVLREMAMAQLKKDDENLKKWIAMI